MWNIQPGVERRLSIKARRAGGGIPTGNLRPIQIRHVAVIVIQGQRQLVKIVWCRDFEFESRQRRRVLTEHLGLDISSWMDQGRYAGSASRVETNSRGRIEPSGCYRIVICNLIPNILSLGQVTWLRWNQHASGVALRNEAFNDGRQHGRPGEIYRARGTTYLTTVRPVFGLLAAQIFIAFCQRNARAVWPDRPLILVGIVDSIHPAAVVVEQQQFFAIVG